MLQGETTTAQPNAVGAKVLTAGDVLNQKGSSVLTARAGDPLGAAVKVLAEHSVGSLLVVEDNKLVGILSERDVLRASVDGFEKLTALKVGDLMTRAVIIGLVGDSLDYIMCLMTERHIRHLPILDLGGKLVGILSIGDVVKTRARQAEVDIRYLTDYITGQYPT